MKSTTAKHSTSSTMGRFTLQALTLVLLFGAGMRPVMAEGLAIEGYDPVAYFTMAEPTRGMESISHEWLGDTWLFASAENKALFIASPMDYMPNYGGYCSYDPVSRGHDHEIDPTAWRIVDDKLYLFQSEMTADHAIPTEIWEGVKAGLAQ